jgi:FixJ family two-component response regulator
LSGLQLYDRLAAERPELKVVFTSGYSGDTPGMDTVLKADNNFLPKPHSPTDLVELLVRKLAVPG